MGALRDAARLRGLLAGMLLWAMLGWFVPAWAAPVAGVVVHLSGPLLAKKASGAVKILSVKSEVENGDTLVTEKNTYAMVKFIDNSEITLRPGSTLTVENFSFAADKADGDQAKFNLVKGGLRSVTGLLGKRSKEKFELKTPTATIGIRGTTFIVEFVPPPPGPATAPAAVPPGVSRPSGAPSLPQPPASPAAQSPLTPGLYVQVLDGQIFVANNGGSTNFNAGQFGFTPSFTQPPVIVPANPGLQFAPPPVFNNPPMQGPNAPPPKTTGVDCEVR